MAIALVFPELLPEPGSAPLSPLPSRFLFPRAVAMLESEPVLLLFFGCSTLLSFATDDAVGKGSWEEVDVGFGVVVELFDGVKAGLAVSVGVGLDDKLDLVVCTTLGVDVGFNSGV